MIKTIFFKFKTVRLIKKLILILCTYGKYSKTMETRLNKKITFYYNDMRESIIHQMQTLKDSTLPVDEQYESLKAYIKNYKDIVLQKEDFNKRKRNKNVVNDHEKCQALRNNGEQCSRRQRSGEQFCGTHLKGTPYGVVGAEVIQNAPIIEKCELTGTDENGIIVYRDKHGVEYDMEKLYTWKQNVNNGEKKSVVRVYKGECWGQE